MKSFSTKILLLYISKLSPAFTTSLGCYFELKSGTQFCMLLKATPVTINSHGQLNRSSNFFKNEDFNKKLNGRLLSVSHND